MFDCDDSESGFLGFRIGSGNNHNEGYGQPGYDENGDVDMSHLTEAEQEEWDEIAELREKMNGGDSEDDLSLPDLGLPEEEEL